MSLRRKWDKFNVSDYDLVKVLNQRSAEGWEIFSIEKDPEATYGKFIVIAWRNDV